jgi:hypothetical protein
MDPQILRSIAANPAAYPGSPPSPVDATAPAAAPPDDAEPEEEQAEPVALHEAAIKAQKSIAQALADLAELHGLAQTADDIDAKVESAIEDCMDALQEVDDDFDDVVSDLGDARDEHEQELEDEEDD